MKYSKHTLSMVFLSLGLWHAEARADNTFVPGSASVHLDGCDAIDVEDLRRGIELERFDRAKAVDVFVTCKPESTVASIRIFSPGASGVRHGTIDFQGVESIAWTRSLALTIAELERAATQVSRSEHFARPAPTNRPVPPRVVYRALEVPATVQQRVRDVSEANSNAGLGRWWIEARSSTQSQSWSVASSTTNAVHSNYDFTVVEFGGGFRPLEWMSIGVTMGGSIGSYSELDHEASADLPGELSGPSYSREAITIDVRPLSWRTLEVHAIASVSSHDVWVAGRSMDNTVYALDWLDPVSGEWSEYSAGVLLKWSLRPWLRVSAAYEAVEIGDMDLSHRGTASDVSGERAEIGLDVDLIDGVSLHGNLGAQSVRANAGNTLFGQHLQQASLRLQMNM
ncbi:MAG: hypothetical protein JKY56_13155 [Kofleriaceae bacterium]|nr:hypothetical protein [Kofleriaceae bacterium]